MHMPPIARRDFLTLGSKAIAMLAGGRSILAQAAQALASLRLTSTSTLSRGWIRATISPFYSNPRAWKMPIRHAKLPS